MDPGVAVAFDGAADPAVPVAAGEPRGRAIHSNRTDMIGREQQIDTGGRTSLQQD